MRHERILPPRPSLPTHAEGRLVRPRRARLNPLQRFVADHADPMKLILDALALIWAAYFLWYQDALSALLSVAFFGGLGMIATWKLEQDKLIYSSFGKFWLTMANPVNMTFQALGYLGVMYGFWQHASAMILAGVTLVLIGHLFGWQDRSVPRI